MQYLSAKDIPASEPLPAPFVPDTFPEDVTPLVPASDADTLRAEPAARRSYFTKAPHRASTSIQPTHLLRGDFSHGFLNFDSLSVSLPGGLSFSLAKYWNGEPVVFSCQKRGTGETFFVVSFALEDEDADAEGGAQGDGAGEQGEANDVD